MPKPTKYFQGQVIGPYEIKYIQEAEPDINKQNPNNHIRKAVFECGLCGKHFIARIGNIKNGHTKSCGCRDKQVRTERIQRYNSLGLPVWNKKEYSSGDTVGEYGVIFLEECNTENKKYRKAKFICPICGRSFEAIIDNVVQGRTKGCGSHCSHGEEKIAKCLQELKIPFETQKTFKDLVSEKGWKYRFDFYLPTYNLLVEYDGIQHFQYKENTCCWNNKHNFLDTQQRDAVKMSIV